MTTLHTTGIKQEIAEENTILRALVGSSVHGLGIAGTDDRDEMGVVLEPPEYVIGLRHFEQYIQRDQPNGVRSQPGDLDLVLYSLRKWCSLALKGNPSVLLLLFVPEEQCVVVTREGRSLRQLAWAFASKRAGAAFMGYMVQQKQRLLGERGQKNVKRPELEEAYGFDTKYASHILRLGYQGIEYMNTGQLSLPMSAPEQKFIRDVRTGKVEFQDVMTHAGILEKELQDAIDGSPLPDQPDYEAVNNFLISTYSSWWWKAG